MKTQRFVLMSAALLLWSRPAVAAPFTFDQQADNQVDGWYYAVSGGIFPTGTDPNGSRASGGTFARIWDDPTTWGATNLNTWVRDGWFTQSAGMAVTLYDGATAVYDNNGIDAGTYGNFYSALAQGTANAATPGLYQMYSNANNYDHIYATYLKLEQATTITSINSFFNFNGLTGDFNPFASSVGYLMNFWSVVGDCQQDNVGCLPVNTNSFIGDVLSSYSLGGNFTVTDSGAVRQFDNGSTDAIGRLTWTLPNAVVLPAGEYYFSASATVVPEPATLLLLGAGLAAVSLRVRKHRRPRV